VSTPTTPYADLVAPFIISGIGMALFFAPVANVVLSAVRPQEEGQASGANNAIRELGGVFGVAVLASVFAHYGGYTSAASFTHGMSISVWIGAVVGRLRCGRVVRDPEPAPAARGRARARVRVRGLTTFVPGDAAPGAASPVDHGHDGAA
jgi:MFS family permease